MKFSIFPSVTAKGQLATAEAFNKLAESYEVKHICSSIIPLVEAIDKGNLSEEKGREVKDKISALKKRLPVATFQAFFPSGHRVAKEAEPSGMYMLDIDHVDNPHALWAKAIVSHISEWGIVYAGKTPSTHGLRVVAKCRPEFTTIEECQKWLAGKIGTGFDEVCKDWSRSSFLVPSDYIYYMDYGAMFQDDPQVFYKNTAKEEKRVEAAPVGNQLGNLFGEVQKEFKGIALRDICVEWLKNNGGEPTEGERNASLYKLALRLRYICDFNEYNMLHNMPRYGLAEEEMKQLIHSACTTARGSNIPADLNEVLHRMAKRATLADKSDTEVIVDEEQFRELNDTTHVPPLPPLFREIYDIAPDDFKVAATVCQLPILGALGSRLRATYIDGNVHSPTFQVSLEAPQASGKSFVRKLVEYELAAMIEHDEVEFEKERQYNEKVKEIKLLNTKVTKKDKDAVLGERPQCIIRYVSPKMSITKMLMRMNSAQGLHLFAMAEEIDTVYKSFKKSISSYSDALRCSFDNAAYGQDYASENSFSGIVKLYYNTLFAGTPKAMRRFYPDVEDGLVSRVTFVTLPDQFGKPLPVWGKLSPAQKKIVDVNLVRLNEVSMIGEDVQPEHNLKIEWLGKEMQAWVSAQQQMAVQMNDRTRDIFCRRSAVVGFRAGMIAYFLYNEKNTPTIRRNVVNFSRWIANLMLKQEIIRFTVGEDTKNTFPFKTVYDALPDNFTRAQLESELAAQAVQSPVKMVIYKWKVLNKVETDKSYGDDNIKKVKNGNNTNRTH